MKAAFFILSFFSLFILSCKKETETIVARDPETSCVCLKENIGVPMGNSVPCNGFFIMNFYNDITPGRSYSITNASAYFNKVSSLFESSDDIVKVDSVYLNQLSLKSVKDANDNHLYYQRESDSLPTLQEWKIYGSNGIPTFSLAVDVKNPLVDLSGIPDTISKSIVRSFKLNGVTNITRGSALLFSGEHSGSNVSVILREGSNEVCFPSEQVKVVSAGKATVMISLENTITRSVGSKNFAFSKKWQFLKSVILVP
jgi:hypothetical protein